MTISPAQSTRICWSSEALKVNQEKWKRVYQRLCANGFTLSSLNLNLGCLCVVIWVTEWVQTGLWGSPKWFQRLQWKYPWDFWNGLERHSLCFAPGRGCSRDCKFHFIFAPSCHGSRGLMELQCVLDLCMVVCYQCCWWPQKFEGSQPTEYKNSVCPSRWRGTREVLYILLRFVWPSSGRHYITPQHRIPRSFFGTSFSSTETNDVTLSVRGSFSEFVTENLWITGNPIDDLIVYLQLVQISTIFLKSISFVVS